LLTLNEDDPTIFAKCPRCTKRGNGRSVMSYYAASYSIRRWRRNPQCENCETPMQEIYRIEVTK
jgi:hypothetical protein